MRITNLQKVGVKSPATTDHALAPVTVVTGENFTGKTALLDSLRLGLIGYLPELGKRPSDTFALAANGAMRVNLTFDDGSMIARSWKRERGTVKLTSNGDVSVPTVLIDPSEYFSLGDKDRVRYVFKLAAASVDGAADAVISKLKGIAIDGHNQNHEAVINELVNLVDETDRARHEADQPVPEWIEALIASVRDRLKASKAEADRMAKTVTGMAVVDCADDEAAAKNVSYELEAKRKRLGDLQQQIGKLLSTQTTAAAAAERRKALQDRIANFKPQGQPIEELKAKRDALVPKAEEPRKLTDAMTKLSTARSAEATARALRDNLSQAIEKTMDELEEKKVLPHCPFCGAKGEGWIDHLLAEFDQRIKAQQTELTAREAALKKAAAGLRTAETAVTKAKEHDAEVDAAIKEATALNDEIARSQAAEERIRGASETLASIEVVDTTATEAEFQSVRAQVETLKTEIAGLAARHDKFIQQQQSAVLAAKASQRHDYVNAAVAVEAEAVKLLEALQIAMVGQAFGAILGTANKLTAGILKGALAYHEGEIGRWDDGLWIAHHSFSGTEKALAYAGISVALAAQSPVKIVLLDEMGRLTALNKSRVVERLIELIKEGVIDQAVCVDVDASAYHDFALDSVGLIKL